MSLESGDPDHSTSLEGGRDGYGCAGSVSVQSFP